MDNWVTSNLSPEQQRPLLRSEKNTCILAAAGSGKTRALTYSLTSDLSAGVPAPHIAAFTFTEKAANELSTRVHLLANKHIPDIDVAGMYVGTIHGWCLQYLMENSDFYNFTPLDELHVSSLVSRLYDHLCLENAYNEGFPFAVDSFIRDIEVFYNEGMTVDQVSEPVQGSIIKFLNVLKNNRLLTFGGMIRSATEHLQDNGPLPFLKRLYVDEYQDVNPAQVALIKAMRGSETELVAVGDDHQCIYNWRGSDVTQILNFKNEFEDALICRLADNYRSRPSIVDFANSIGSHISLGDSARTMRPKRPISTASTCEWVSVNGDQAQARAVADAIERFRRQGVPYNQIAILLRSVLSWGPAIVDELKSREIPVACPILSRGGEIIDELVLPLFRWLKREPREPANEVEQENLDNHLNSLEKAVAKWSDTPEAINVFWTHIDEWTDSIEEGKNDAYNVRKYLYELLDKLNVKVGLNDYNLTVGIGIASQIIRSVEEVHRRRIKTNSRFSARRLMGEVYYAISRHKDSFGESVPVQTSQNGVLVSTVHQAKGKEWPVVIIPMVMSRRFPVASRQHNTSHPDSVAKRYGTTVEDERRLFYVAVTRAKDRLLIIDGAKTEPSKESQFRRELEGSNSISMCSFNEISYSFWDLNIEKKEESDPEPFRVGLSDLLLYVDCPFQYGLRRIANIQPAVGDELGFGRSLHELIQRRLESDLPWDNDDLNEQVQSHVFLPLMSESSEIISREAIRRRIAHLENMGVFNVNTQSEVDIEFVLEGGIVSGTVDGISQEEAGQTSIVEWKSNVNKEFLDRYIRQIVFYCNALKSKGININKAEILDVGSSFRQDSVVKHEADISTDSSRETLEEISVAMRGVSMGYFDPKPSKSACSSCDVHHICKFRYPFQDE